MLKYFWDASKYLDKTFALCRATLALIASAASHFLHNPYTFVLVSV